MTKESIALSLLFMTLLNRYRWHEIFFDCVVRGTDFFLVPVYSENDDRIMYKPDPECNTPSPNHDVDNLHTEQYDDWQASRHAGCKDNWKKICQSCWKVNIPQRIQDLEAFLKSYEAKSNMNNSFDQDSYGRGLKRTELELLTNMLEKNSENTSKFSAEIKKEII